MMQYIIMKDDFLYRHDDLQKKTVLEIEEY